MKRPGYKEAIRWIADNDDTEWVNHPNDSAQGTPCVAACLVADLFGTTENKWRPTFAKSWSARKSPNDEAKRTLFSEPCSHRLIEYWCTYLASSPCPLFEWVAGLGLSPHQADPGKPFTACDLAKPNKACVQKTTRLIKVQNVLCFEMPKMRRRTVPRLRKIYYADPDLPGWVFDGRREVF